MTAYLCVAVSCYIFTARRVCIMRTMPWQDVCLSVRLSQAGIESHHHFSSLFRLLKKLTKRNFYNRGRHTRYVNNVNNVIDNT